MNLMKLGWNNSFQVDLQMARQENPEGSPARVIRTCRGHFNVSDGEQEYQATLSGRMRHTCETEHDHVVTGDWVVLRDKDQQGSAVIDALLPRLNAITRKTPGDKTVEQVMVANIDVCFLVCALDGSRSFNTHRIERYLSLANDSHTEPAIILNKVDLCETPDDYIAQAQAISKHVPVYAVSALTGQGMDQIQSYLSEGVTAVLLGSSGAGKSALTNTLLGHEQQSTYAVREQDGRGRHTTTQREMLMLPTGGIIIDTPGLRELQLWGTEESLNLPFADIIALTQHCKFRDCSHEGEPGCAVQTALCQGELDTAHYENYLHMRKELAYLAQRQTQKAALIERKKWKGIRKWQKELKNNEKN